MIFLIFFQISRKSAGNVKRSKAEIDADPEQEDEFGYTKCKGFLYFHLLKLCILLRKGNYFLKSKENKDFQN